MTHPPGRTSQKKTYVGCLVNSCENTTMKCFFTCCLFSCLLSSSSWLRRKPTARATAWDRVSLRTCSPRYPSPGTGWPGTVPGSPGPATDSKVCGLGCKPLRDRSASWRQQQHLKCWHWTSKLGASSPGRIFSTAFAQHPSRLAAGIAPGPCPASRANAKSLFHFLDPRWSLIIQLHNRGSLVF